jgi:Cd(II)/Pb(II)-responsive transcriptional regulator
LKEVVMSVGMKIGELAQRAGCQVETVRYYEREGLLPPPTRSGANYRLYDGSDVERLSFIRHCRSLDMALAEIRVLLKFRDTPGDRCGDVDALLDEHIAQVAARITELTALKAQLIKLRRACSTVSTAAECGILNELATDAAVAPCVPNPRIERKATVQHPYDVNTDGKNGTSMR